MLTFGERV